MHGEGIWADVIRQRFEKKVARLGIGIRSGRFKLAAADPLPRQLRRELRQPPRSALQGQKK